MARTACSHITAHTHGTAACHHRGLYDMFKLPRDIAIEWFEKRRQLDAERQQQQAVAAGAAGAAGKAAGARKDMWSFEHKGKQAAAAAQRGPAAGPRSSELSELLGDAELPEGVEAAGQQQQRKEGVYKLTPKELAMVGGWSGPAAVGLNAMSCEAAAVILAATLAANSCA